AELDALPQEARATRFFSIWALKESYIKARGLGLRLPLKEISFGFDDGDHRARLDAVPPAGASTASDAVSHWHVALEILDDPSPHALAVTVAAEGTTGLEVRRRVICLGSHGS
ncbi:MAG: 4'-phosphopantetheinyl transferase superfamily protein, partial [Planctomycetota bacterium]